MWRVYIHGKSTQNTFEWDQVRGSIAYRALCFEDKEEMENWNEYDINIDSGFTIDGVMDTLKRDLVERNRIGSVQWDKMDRFELGKLIMAEYIKLPPAELSYIPLNYCTVLDMMPKWLVNSGPVRFVERIWC